MKTLDIINTDLEYIHEYYRLKDMEHPSKIVHPRDFEEILEAYNSVFSKQAPKILHTVYNGLYVRSLTQKSLANELTVTENYVQMLHKRLKLFFMKSFSRSE